MAYIYLLKDKKGLCYVGKTEDIKMRINTHKGDIKNNKNCSSKGLDLDFECEILEEVGNEYDLSLAEQKWYDLLKTQIGEKLLNKNRPLNTIEEWREDNKIKRRDYNKIYYTEHKVYRTEKQKLYHEQHKAERVEYLKQYHEQHKAVINERSKKWRLENKQNKQK